MVTKSEMRGIQGWFLKRLGCFSIDQISPSISVLRHAVNLIEKKEQLVVFPEGKINKYGKIILRKIVFGISKIFNSELKVISDDSNSHPEGR